MGDVQDNHILVINPLKSTLAHYERELIETLNYSARAAVELAESVPGDNMKGAVTRIVTAVRTVRERTKLARIERSRVIIVVWPLFGYLEPLTLMQLAKRNTVYLVVHDPLPLRQSYGQSKLARKLFRKMTERFDIKVVYHTAHAQKIGVDNNGVEGVVVPHPIRFASAHHPHRSALGHSRPVVRVLGQYKRTRSLSALTDIAVWADGSCDLEIYGRGWPDIPGWSVSDRFVPEHEFSDLLRSSDCVVIPYGQFFQSGVAVRCLEAGVPVVAPHHEHIAELFGSDWTGAVRNESDWGEALLRVLDLDAAGIDSRYLDVAAMIGTAWGELLSTGD